MLLKDSYYTVSEAASALGVTRQTIHRWLRQEIIASSEKIGKERVILKTEITKVRALKLCPTCGQLLKNKYRSKPRRV